MSKWDKPRQERVAKIVALYNSGLTNAEIAEQLECSHQNISLNIRWAKSQGVYVRKNEHLKQERRLFKCACGKELLVSTKIFAHKKRCTINCPLRWKFLPKEEQRKLRSERVKWRYHNEPGVKENRTKHTMRYYEKVKNTTHFKKRVSETLKKWIAKNPERAKANRRRGFEKLRADPAIYRAYLDRKNQANKIQRDKKKESYGRTS